MIVSQLTKINISIHAVGIVLRHWVQSWLWEAKWVSFFVLLWKKYDRDTGDKYVYVLVSSYNVDLCMGFIKHWAILSPVTLCYWQEIV